MHINTKWISVFLFMLVTTAGAENPNISNLKKMNNEEVIQLFANPKWEGKAFSEITRRVRENDSIQNEEIEKLMFQYLGKSNNNNVKELCLRGLYLIQRQEDVDYLITQLLEGNTRLDRTLAAHYLGTLRNASAVPALEYAVSADRANKVFGEGRSIAREAITALGRIGKPAVPSLIRIWEDKRLRAGCKEGIMSAMGYTKDIRCKPILLKVLEGKDELARDNAAWALGEIGDDTVLPELKKYQNDSNKNVKDNVLEAISKIEQRAGKEEKANVVMYQQSTNETSTNNLIAPQPLTNSLTK